MIGFVATNFNNSEYTVNYIRSVLEYGTGDFVVIIIDNASDCSQLEILKTSGVFDEPNVLLRENKENIGYFPGLNVGISYLVDNYDIDFLVVGNNDILFNNEFFIKLDACSDGYEDYPVVAPAIVTLDGVHQNPHVRIGISWVRERMYDLFYFNYYISRLILNVRGFFKGYIKRKDEESFATPGLISQGFGACYILTRLFIKEFRYLKGPSFLYHEEAFLRDQLAEKGYSVYYEPRLEVRHVWHSATGSLSSRRKWRVAASSHWELRRSQRRSRIKND
jgi:GT2 family glycosyltransferase